MRHVASLSIASLFALVACAPVGDVPPPGTPIVTAVQRESAASVTLDTQQTLTRAQLSFGFTLGPSALPPTSNAVISPWSIHTALTMAHLGARGETASQLSAVLQTGAMGESALDAYNAVDRALVAQRTHGVILRSANAVFAQRGLRFVQSYVDGLAAHFPVGLSAMDFVAQADASRSAINQWVSSTTEGRIPALFPAGSIHADTRVVLVNATYFYGPWRAAFDPALTQASPFALAQGGSALVPTMRRAMSVRAASSDGWRAIELPYANDNLSMLVIIPNDGDVAAIEARLSEGRLVAVTSALEALPPSVFEVRMPRFRFTTRLDLSSRLSAMGARAAFDASADFSGLSEDGPMHIEQVIHSAVIAVDERGAEAAAATGVTFGVTSLQAPVPSFDVDRPFVFVVREKQTGAPLFIGHVVDPRA